jgi:hypothetical protein
MHVNGERMDLRYVLSVLMGHRDAVHRWAAEAGAQHSPDVPAGTSARRG